MGCKYQILLQDNNGFQWYLNKDTAIKGYAWFHNKCYLDNELLYLFEKIKSKEDLIQLLTCLNGCFAGYVTISNDIYLFTDYLRSFPLFYDVKNKIITDNSSLELLIESELDTVAIAELLKTNMFVCNDRTIIKNLKQVMMGELIKFSDLKEEVEVISYYKHQHFDHNKKNTKSDYLEEINNLSVRVFQRLIKSLNNKTAIIPLSGGYDSRYIAVMLKKLNYKNVICFTYGFSEDTYETGISKQVAANLGYKHYFIKMDAKLWNKFFTSKTVDEFLKYDFNYFNLPHVQEIMALIELRKLEEFPKDGIVIPGFCGDIFGGSYTLSNKENKNYNYSQDLFINYIYNTHFTAREELKNYDKEIKADIYDYCVRKNIYIHDFITFNSEQEEWFLSHKIAQFILPCLKTYTFFGYTWRMPLWDKELMEYWYNIPVKYKQMDSLYDYSLRRLFFQPMDVDFKKDSPKIKKNIQKYERKAYKTAIYSIIMRIYYKTGCMIYFRKESNNFDYLCRQCYKKLRNKKFVHFWSISIFDTLTLWWLEYILTPNTVKSILDYKTGRK